MSNVLWTPAQITTALWLDAADASSITSSSGTASQWSDKSGNSRHATQTDSARRPGTGTATQNSSNVLVFDGSNDFMITPNVFTSASDVSVFIVHYAAGEDSTGNAVMALQDGHNSTNGFFDAVQRTDLTNKFRSLFTTDSNTAGALSLNPPVTSATGQWVVSAHSRKSSNQSLSWNGTFAESAASGQCNFSNAKAIIGSYYATTSSYTWSGRIAEIIVLSTYASEETRQKIEGYLAHKWGLVANLPSGHPYKSAAPTVPVLSGVVTVNSSPSQRTVLVYKNGDADLFMSTQSDATTGEWQVIVGGEETDRYRVVMVGESGEYSKVFEDVTAG